MTWRECNRLYWESAKGQTRMCKTSTKEFINFRFGLFLLVLLMLWGCGGEKTIDKQQGPSEHPLTAECFETIPDEVHCSIEQENATPFSGGTGTLADPFLLCSIEQLRNVNNALDKNFRLMSDLNFRLYSGQPVQIGSALMGFSAQFDGNGRTIRNFASTSGGLFALLPSQANIKNLSILDAVVSGDDNVGILGNSVTGKIEACRTSGTVVGKTAVGGISGILNQGATLERSCSSAEVGGKDGVGGLVGKVIGTSANQVAIRRSFSTGNVRIDPPGTNGGFVGGLMGQLFHGNIEDSFSAARVTGNGWTGGIVGSARNGSLSRVYFSGSVRGENTPDLTNSAVGGIAGTLQMQVVDSFSVGLVSGDSTVLHLGGIAGILVTHDLSNTYLDTSKSGVSVCYPPSGIYRGDCTLVNNEATEPNRFFTAISHPMNLWDFANVWIEEKGTYPVLR